MNILMLVPDHLMIDRRVVQQAASLVRAGHAVNLLAGFHCAQNAFYEDRGVRIHRYRFDWSDPRLVRLPRWLPVGDRLRRFVARAGAAAVRRLSGRRVLDEILLSKAAPFPADVVHVHDLTLLRFGVELAMRNDARLVYDAHEIYHQQQTLAPRLRRRLAAEERRLIGRVDLFLCVNAAAADYFESAYGVRPLVIMNCGESPPRGFDVDARNRLRTTAGLAPETRIVLFQGWFSAERNLLNLLRAVEFLPDDAALVLIGYGEYETTLRRALKGKPWQSRVRLLGAVPSDQLPSFTAGADLGVIPYQPIDLNHRLCSPNKFFEFVQAGVPVLAENLVFFRAMQQRYGIVETADLSNPRTIATAVNGLLEAPHRLRQMRAACREAAKTLNWETEAAKLLAAYPCPKKAEAA